METFYDMLGDASGSFLRRQIALSKIVRTDEEVKAEIAELKKLKKNLPSEQINAQLRVLRDRLSHEEAGILFEDSSDDVEHAALDAADWLVREEYPNSDINPDEPPSSAWKQMLTERTAA